MTLLLDVHTCEHPASSIRSISEIKKTDGGPRKAENRGLALLKLHLLFQALFCHTSICKLRKLRVEHCDVSPRAQGFDRPPHGSVGITSYKQTLFSTNDAPCVHARRDSIRGLSNTICSSTQALL